jgi:hypothetical protein
MLHPYYRAHEPRRTPVNWRPSPIRLDQGREGACVSFGCTHELLFGPQAVTPKTLGRDPNAFASRQYRRMQDIDEFPDTHSGGEEGTSVNAGARVMRELGFISGFVWPRTTEDIIDALHDGPVVVGWNLTEGMWDTRPSGLYEINGYNIGGHCMVLTGYSPKRTLPGERGYFELVKGRNSWGKHWGYRGDFYMKVEDLDNRHNDGGEACLFLGRRTKPLVAL